MLLRKVYDAANVKIVHCGGKWGRHLNNLMSKEDKLSNVIPAVGFRSFAQTKEQEGF